MDKEERKTLVRERTAESIDELVSEMWNVPIRYTDLIATTKR